MNGRITVKLMELEVPLWFNNYSKVELAKALLPPRKGYSAKPEEVQLLNAVKERAAENHVVLMLDLVDAGHLGYVYGTNSKVRLHREVLAKKLAEASQEELYGVWLAFLEAYGFNLDTVVELSEKKKKIRAKLLKELKRS